MQVNKILIAIFVAGLFFTSCEQLLEPDNDNHSTTERFYTDPAWAEGVFINAYVNLPNVQTLDEIATDDAVTNEKGNPYQRMATGEWSAIYDPMSIWNVAYKQLYYINYFLSIVDTVDYAWDDKSTPSAVRDSLFKRRFKGEAKILRAWYNFELLKRHGGVASNGQPQGFIILKERLDRFDNYNLPRSSYEECVNFILEDIDEGISLLPNVYVNTGNVAYDKVFGNTNKVNEGRVHGKFAKALKSRVTLYVASQPFYAKATKWEDAAANAQKLLSTAGGGVNGITGMSATGVNF